MLTNGLPFLDEESDSSSDRSLQIEREKKWTGQLGGLGQPVHHLGPGLNSKSKPNDRIGLGLG